MSKKEKFTVYSIIDEMYNKNILTTDFKWEKVKGGNKVIDNNALRVLFTLQSREMFDVINAKEARKANKNMYANYVRIESDDDSALIQLWGKVNRGEKGEVIIEFRQKLYDMLKCDDVKLFRDCKHETYKHNTLNRLCVVDNTKDAIKIITAFIERLNKTKRTNNTEEETTVEEVVEEVAK